MRGASDRVVHHAPMRTDEQLLAMDQAAQEKGLAIRFGRAGDEWMLGPKPADSEGN